MKLFEKNWKKILGIFHYRWWKGTISGFAYLCARFARISPPPWPLKTKNFLEILSIFLNKRRICQLTTTSRKKPSCVHNTINICRRHSRINNPQNKFCFKYPVYALLELFLSFMAWYKKTNTFSSTEVSRDRLTSALRRTMI